MEETLSIEKKKRESLKGALEGALRPLVKTTQNHPQSVCAVKQTREDNTVPKSDLYTVKDYEWWSN